MLFAAELEDRHHERNEIVSKTLTFLVGGIGRKIQHTLVEFDVRLDRPRLSHKLEKLRNGLGLFR